VNSELHDGKGKEIPLVSIIMATYNRAHTIERAIDSALKQTYKNIELIIIDDGSTDDTQKILSKYHDPRISIHVHEKNKGVTGAKNSGLDRIKGDWFTILDSDDEIIPQAIETMMNIPYSMDPTITAVTCNCMDTTTNGYSGKGLMEDQYLDEKTLMTLCKGEFWGITKTSLLQNDRFNEKLRGFENILWYKMNDRAKRYYIHAPLRVYHTEGDDRLMKSKYNFNKEIALYENLVYEEIFLNKLKTYHPQQFFFICKNGMITMRVSNRKELALKYYELSKSITRSSILDLSYKYKFFSILMKKTKVVKSLMKSKLNSLKGN